MTLIRRKAQGATEYAIFIAAVLAGLLALQVYYSRAVKGKVKSSAESIGEQFELNTANYTTTTASASGQTSAVNTGKAGEWSNTTTLTANNATLTGFVPTSYGTITYAGGQVSKTTTIGNMSTGIVNNTTVWQDAGL